MLQSDAEERADRLRRCGLTRHFSVPWASPRAHAEQYQTGSPERDSVPCSASRTKKSGACALLPRGCCKRWDRIRAEDRRENTFALQVSWQMPDRRAKSECVEDARRCNDFSTGTRRVGW